MSRAEFAKATNCTSSVGARQLSQRWTGAREGFAALSWLLTMTSHEKTGKLLPKPKQRDRKRSRPVQTSFMVWTTLWTIVLYGCWHKTSARHQQNRHALTVVSSVGLKAVDRSHEQDDSIMVSCFYSMAVLAQAEQTKRGVIRANGPASN